MANHPWEGRGWVTWTIQILVGTNHHMSCHVDRLRCCQLRWTVSVINWWRSSVTSLSHLPSTSVYNRVGVRHRVARVCQRRRRLVISGYNRFEIPLHLAGAQRRSHAGIFVYGIQNSLCIHHDSSTKPQQYGEVGTQYLKTLTACLYKYHWSVVTTLVRGKGRSGSPGPPGQLHPC